MSKINTVEIAVAIAKGALQLVKSLMRDDKDVDTVGAEQAIANTVNELDGYAARYEQLKKSGAPID